MHAAHCQHLGSPVHGFLAQKACFQWLKAKPSLLICVGKSAVTFWQIGGLKISLQAPVSFLKKVWASVTPDVSSTFQMVVSSLS